MRLASPSGNGGVLDVATGTGFVATEFARKTSGLTVGTDITKEMLVWARKHSVKEQVQVIFLIAEASRQPFPDQSFDTVVSRLAIHHIRNPLAVLNEMRRVCKNEGSVVIADQISPEDEAAAEFHDNFEKYRDPSHERALRLSEFKSLLDQAGLVLATDPEFVPVTLELDEWAARAGCGRDKVWKLREMLTVAEPRFREAFAVSEQDGRVYFQLQRTILVGKPVRA